MADRNTHNVRAFHRVDLTEYPAEDFKYFAELGRRRIELEPDPGLYFSAVIDGRRKGIAELLSQCWSLQTDSCLEITMDEAKVFSRQLLGSTSLADEPTKRD